MVRDNLPDSTTSINPGHVAARHHSHWVTRPCCRIDCVDGCCDSCLMSTCCVIVDSVSMEKCWHASTNVFADLVLYGILFGIPSCVTVAIYLALEEKTFAGVAVVSGALVAGIAARKYHKVKLERGLAQEAQSELHRSFIHHEDHHEDHHGDHHHHPPVPDVAVPMVAHAVPGPENHHDEHHKHPNVVPVATPAAPGIDPLSALSDNNDLLHMWLDEPSTVQLSKEDHLRTLKALRAHSVTHIPSEPIILSPADSDISDVAPLPMPSQPKRLSVAVPHAMQPLHMCPPPISPRPGLLHARPALLHTTVPAVPRSSIPRRPSATPKPDTEFEY